jgi:hypothetical protein
MPLSMGIYLRNFEDLVLTIAPPWTMTLSAQKGQYPFVQDVTCPHMTQYFFFGLVINPKSTTSIDMPLENQDSINLLCKCSSSNLLDELINEKTDFQRSRATCINVNASQPTTPRSSLSQAANIVPSLISIHLTQEIQLNPIVLVIE